MIRLAVNVRTLRPDQIGGLEGAFRHVFDILLRDARRELEVTLFTAPFNHASFGAWEGLARRELLLASESAESWAARLAGFDLLYCPLLFLEPEDPPLPSVVMIPDLQHLTHPEFFTPEILELRLREFRTSASRARRVLTISEFSRDEILRAFHLPAERVVVTPLDSAPVFRDPPDAGRLEALRRRLGLPAEWLLFPANDWPHKNHAGLFRALAVYRARFGEPPPVLLTGARVGGGDLDAEARRAGVADLVRHVEWVEPREMPLLYDGAAGLVFLSLFEGFGMPVVEAMRRGTPILASNRTSLPEVTGGHALLVDPLDAEAAAAGLHELLSRPEAARERAAAARQWASRYSFERAAEQTLVAFRDALSDPRAAKPLSITVAASPPRVFVVTPSFQQAPFLRRTIDSVLAQDYPHLDYLVADGGSTDGSVEILRSYGERVRWISGPDGGQAAAIARAWGESRADVVAWLNSDDTYLPGAVSRAVDHLLRHPEAAMVYGKAWYIDAEDRTTGPYHTLPFDAAMLRQECFICQPATFLRREVFLRIDLLDPALQIVMDYDLWIRLSGIFGVSYLEDYLACSRVYPETKTLRDRDAVFREIFEVTRRHYGVIPRNWAVGYVLHRARDRTERSFRYLPRWLRDRVSAALARALERRYQCPLHPDGWAGTSTLVDVRCDASGQAVLRVESPFWPYREPLRIRVEHEGRRVAERVIERRGESDLRFELPATGGGEEFWARVLLRASRTFVPSLSGYAPDDPRPVSFRVVG